MHRSHVVEVFGQFMGAAMRRDQQICFVAVDKRVHALDRSVWRDLPSLERDVTQLLLRDAAKSLEHFPSQSARE